MTQSANPVIVGGNKRKLIGIYFILMLLSLVTFIGGAFVLALQNINTAQDEFDQYVNQVHRSLAESFAINETILDGFAAFLAEIGMQDPNRARFYARKMIERYNHLYMFQAAQRVDGDTVVEFEQSMSKRLDEPMLVRRFEFGQGLVPALETDHAQYFPIVFVEPTFSDGFNILGLDISSIQFIKDAMDNARSSGLGAISQPIELSEGEPAFVLIKPVYQQMEAEPGQYALLVVQADELIPALRPQDDGFFLKLSLGEGEFSFLNLQTEKLSQWEQIWFPLLTQNLTIRVGSQSLALTIEQQLGLRHVDWPLILIMVIITVIIALAVALMLRFHLEAELLKQEASQQLYRQANFDNLTGLANRPFFEGQFRRAIAASKRRGNKVAVLYLDLNDFKHINDTFGHQVGDNILKMAADLITDAIRVDDLAARFGGDEFVVMLETVKSQSDVDLVVARIYETFAMVKEVSGHSVKLKTSIGMAIFPDEGDCLEALIKKADTDMYNQKRSYKELKGRLAQVIEFKDTRNRT